MFHDVSFQTLTATMLIVWSHPTLRATLRSHLLRKNVDNERRTTTENVAVKSFDGRQLAFTPSIERNMYFNSYKEAW